MSKPCSVEGCTRPHLAKGLCGTHWKRQRKYGDLNAGFVAFDRGRPTTAEIFQSRIDRSGQCWIWTGAKSSAGYGQMRIAKKAVFVHRYSFELYRGPVPVGAEVCHRCDTPACCNPDHLFLGTHRENMLDASSKGRMLGNGNRRGSLHGGAKLSDGDVLTIRASTERTRFLATRFGVSRTTVQRIRSGRLWSHL